MKLESKMRKPAGADTLQTFAGDYHRLESTFRPAEKTPGHGAKDRRRTQNKMPRKPAG